MSVHAMWDYRVAVDLFLGGIGTGAFLLAAASRLSSHPAMGRIRTLGLWVAPIAVALGLVFLLTEIGKPGRVFLTIFNTNGSSMMSTGIFLQSLFLAAAGLALILHLMRSEPARDIVLIVGAVLAACVSGYHGLLLADIGLPAWSGAVPALFFVSALTSGAFFVLLINALMPDTSGADSGDLYKVVSGVMLVLMLVQLAAQYAWTYGLSHGDGNAQAAGNAIMGAFGGTWGIFVMVIGALVPIVLLGISALRSTAEGSKPMLAASAALAICGVFVMKYIVVLGGQLPGAM